MYPGTILVRVLYRYDVAYIYLLLVLQILVRWHSPAGNDPLGRDPISKRSEAHHRRLRPRLKVVYRWVAAACRIRGK
jgi:hypothetical protein